MKRHPAESFEDYKQRRRAMKAITKKLTQGRHITTGGTVARPKTLEYRRIQKTGTDQSKKVLEEYNKSSSN